MERKIAYIGGTFDILHAGHVNLINKVIMLGFEPHIVVNSDEFVAEYRGEHCMFKAWERYITLKEMYSCAKLYFTNKDEQRELIEKINPDVIVVGTDWMKPEILPQLGIDEQFLRDNNIAMLFIPRFKSISTTKIKERLQK